MHVRRLLAPAVAAAVAAVAAVVALTAGPAPTAGAAARAGNPLAMTNGFLVDPGSEPNAWLRANPRDARVATIRANIANRPIAAWFGDWTPAVGPAVGAYVGPARTAGTLPVLVAYNLPGRDACGAHSAGGAVSASAYRTWIAAFASAIGARPAVVVLEPDAFGDHDCMTAEQIATRNGLLTFAAQQFRDRAPNTWAYLDAGNAGWVAPATMAARLTAAGVAGVRGFAVNVSNYYTTAQSVAYANAVNAALRTPKPFVVDTSRNGNGHNGQWCNPPGRRLGTPPRIGGGAELLLWVKTVGTSDGRCGIAPATPAGAFDPDLAVRLIDGR